MSEEITNKVEEIAAEAKPAELSDKDLEQVAGGGFCYEYLPHDVLTIKVMPVDDIPLAKLKI